MSASKLEDQFYALWLTLDGPKLKRQTLLKDLIPGWPGKHTVDFCEPQLKLAIEINGGTYAQTTRTKNGRVVPLQMSHNNGKGLRRDYAKQIALSSQRFFSLSLDCTMAKDTALVTSLIDWCGAATNDVLSVFDYRALYARLWYLQKTS